MDLVVFVQQATHLVASFAGDSREPSRSNRGDLSLVTRFSVLTGRFQHYLLCWI